MEIIQSLNAEPDYDWEKISQGLKNDLLRFLLKDYGNDLKLTYQDIGVINNFYKNFMIKKFQAMAVEYLFQNGTPFQRSLPEE